MSTDPVTVAIEYSPRTPEERYLRAMVVALADHTLLLTQIRDRLPSSDPEPVPEVTPLAVDLLEPADPIPNTVPDPNDEVTLTEPDPSPPVRRPRKPPGRKPNTRNGGA